MGKRILRISWLKAFLLCLWLTASLPATTTATDEDGMKRDEARREGVQWRLPLTGTIGAERPGFSTSPDPLTRGHLQMEGGYQFTKDEDGEEIEDHTLPFLLFRLGMFKNLELQVGWSGYSWTEVNSERSHDTSDLSVAAKTKVFDQSGSIPGVGLIGVLSLPTGSGSKTSDKVDPGFGVLWSYNLSQGHGLFGTLLGSSVTEAGDRSFQLSGAAGIGWSLTEKLGTYMEYFAVFREDNGSVHNLNGGFTYLISMDLQVDIHAGVGLNERADDLFIGAGFARRW